MPFNYIELQSYINANISLNYHHNSIIFSLDLKNILGHKMEFFDQYYDDDGFKIAFGISCKF